MPKKRNHWGVPEEPAQARARDQLLLKLGNLTLLTSSLNRAIRDADWSKKKRGKGKNDGLDKFAQGLEIFDTELKLEKWDEVAILTRSDHLFENARVVWSYPTVQ